MSKNTIFSGQPVFTQLLSLIPNHLIFRLVNKYQCDRYCKTFDSKHHLITLLFGIINQCTSLREVVSGLQVATSKQGHFKLAHDIRRSTLADANKRRPEAFFGELFHQLYNYHYGLPDSRNVKPRQPYEKRLFIIDSTTIKLFHDVLKGAGSTPANGKRKGGLKAHVMIKAVEDTPCLVNLTASAANDRVFLKHIFLPKGSIITFDKGYANFRRFDQWSKMGINWVSRVLDKWIVQVDKQNPVSGHQRLAGVISDQLVTLGDPNNNNTLKIKARIVKYHDLQSNKIFSFVSNNTRFLPTTIADIYKQRWQIELLFKRIKQRYPLRYFLGESENAIKTQVWCVLIADLLIKVIQDRTKRKWAYSNLSSIIRLHLMTYVNLLSFLDNPDKVLRKYMPAKPVYQLNLFNSS
ncbi:MAG TPA: IS4 family transposase [Bacteroidales bacterium]